MENKEKTEYEIKKEEKESIRDKRRKEAKSKKTTKNLVQYSLLLVILILLGYGIFVLARSVGPKGEDFSTSYSIQGRDHIDNGEEHPQYNSNPPSSGWHYTQPVPGRFYNEPIADESVIHNLEHGDIWIAYHPNIGSDIKSILKKFAGQYVVVSPRSLNEGDISLVAWGRVDTFNIDDGIVDEERIKDFISRYDNRGPEKVRGAQVGHSGF